MNPRPDFGALLDEVRAVIDADVTTAEEKLFAICHLLKASVDHYDWVGFYLVAPEAVGQREGERELVLGPYVGAPTEHTRIPFGRGICGQAAATEQTFIVQDVTMEDNYLSCSPDVRSEIVLPILDAGEVLGELDIDSHQLSPFTDEDETFLATICDLVVPLV